MDHQKLINDMNNLNEMKNKLEILSKKNYNDESVMYIIVNNDLKMDKGKIAGQTCHSACRVTRIIENLESYPESYITAKFF